MAWLVRDQGTNIVLNLFFGPAINAARGVASQVSNAVMGFISNFQVALNPQITKDYATGNITGMERLSYLGIKYSFLILFMMAFPLCLNIDYVLHLWLVDVPDYAALFIILIMIDALCGTLFGTPFMTSLSATGWIRNYQIVVSCIILCIFPIGYIALKFGCSASSVFYISIFFTLIAGFVRFLFCRSLIGYSLKKLIKDVLSPVAGVTVLSLPLPVFIKYHFLEAQTLGNFISLCIITAIVTMTISWFIGLKKTERNTLISVVKNKLHKK